MPCCLSGGGRAYKLDLEIIKSQSPSTSSWSSSPSSESSNSPVAISTRKPRTPRKRPNQTYHEAAALLSTAYPKIFFSATLRNPQPGKFTRPNNPFSSTSDLIDATFLLPVEKHSAPPCKLLLDSNSGQRFDYCEDFQDDFDAESILDEEIDEGGIDSIMGKLNYQSQSCYGFPIGMGFKGLNPLLKAIKNGDNGDWWRFPSVNVVDITPKAEKSPPPLPEKKKKKKKVEKVGEFRINEKAEKSSSFKVEPTNPEPKSSLLLKLNYDNVLTEWMDRPSPFSDESPCSEAAGTDVQARLAEIDLFSESGLREASVLRYKEKRRTRLFSKKIRYQVRKVNADRRPRMKGRFVRSPNSPDDSEQG